MAVVENQQEVSTMEYIMAWESSGLITPEATQSIDQTKLSDMELCNSAVAGNTLAFEELYHRHHRRVYSLCLRMLKFTDVAEDLTQDVFIQLYRKIATFKGQSAFTSWLHRITVNQVLMHFRNRIVKFETLSEDGELPDVVVKGTSNPRRMNVDDCIVLESAIEELPEGYKNVFLLHDRYGYEHKEVAWILGMSVGTSKSQLCKARMKLRGLLTAKRYFVNNRNKKAVAVKSAVVAYFEGRVIPSSITQEQYDDVCRVLQEQGLTISLRGLRVMTSALRKKTVAAPAE